MRTADEPLARDANEPAVSGLDWDMEAVHGDAARPTNYWCEGALIEDRYQIERKLGGGSMGTVYLARDRMLRKPVALKVLHPEVATHKATVQRFRREVALAHSVTHRKVARIYDAGEAHGLPYISMEFLEGQTLEQLLAETTEADMPLSYREVREILSDLLGGLAAIHRAGIVHRDLKPANVLLTDRGAVVMDFGVAGWSTFEESPIGGAQPRSLVRTEAGTILGSPAYMAPELWDKNPATIQSDFYALGVITYQMLTGRLPYDASDARNYLYQMRTAPPIPIRNYRRDVPWNLAHFVARTMHPDPDKRPNTAGAAARWITPWSHRGKLAATLAFAAIMAIAYGIWHWNRVPSHERLGIDDPMVAMDFQAATRSYDIGDYATATLQLERIARMAPRSAGVAYMRSVIALELDDHRAWKTACTSGGAEGQSPDWLGSPTWVAMARSSCSPQYKITSAEQNLLSGRSSVLDTSALPRIVSAKLAPKLESQAHIHAGLRAQIDTAEQLLDRVPNWNEVDLPIPTRWDLAKVDLYIARAQLGHARSALETLLVRYPTSPIIASRLADLAISVGDVHRAAELAASIRGSDPRPEMRMFLNDGRLEHAWNHIEDRKFSAYHRSLVDMWCGYAARYGHPDQPERCLGLGPGFTRVFASDRRSSATSADIMAMNAVEREIWKLQVRRDARDCVPSKPRTAIVTHASPPFVSYLRQLQIGIAVCAASTDSAQLGRARKLLDQLVDTSPDDPFVLMARATTPVLDSSGHGPSAHDRLASQVLGRWREADDNLELVRIFRSRYEPSVNERELDATAEQPADAPAREPASNGEEPRTPTQDDSKSASPRERHRIARSRPRPRPRKKTRTTIDLNARPPRDPEPTQLPDLLPDLIDARESSNSSTDEAQAPTENPATLPTADKPNRDPGVPPPALLGEHRSTRPATPRLPLDDDLAPGARELLGKTPRGVLPGRSPGARGMGPALDANPPAPLP